MATSLTFVSGITTQSVMSRFKTSCLRDFSWHFESISINLVTTGRFSKRDSPSPLHINSKVLNTSSPCLLDHGSKFLANLHKYAHFELHLYQSLITTYIVSIWGRLWSHHQAVALGGRKAAKGINLVTNHMGAGGATGLNGRKSYTTVSSNASVVL